ncbi:hypothetical protein [Gracilibacillus dipsosauri]|uniref:Uncharacterized protein n=1 Tax=Gracilibacillus dipsosauri TaxID=178340 RepID=A0A317L1X9_9BACI|nr:hypothetical protein [Gracilibacillus dipsosauri]PWU69871.1 hypothetical protein DLJ74_02770 [Gracilibacillus dipsosauri]
MKREIKIFILFSIAYFAFLVILDYILSGMFNWGENAIQAVFTLLIVKLFMWGFNSNNKKS